VLPAWLWNCFAGTSSPVVAIASGTGWQQHYSTTKQQSTGLTPATTWWQEVPIPQERTSRIVLVLFRRYFFTGSRNSNRLATILFHNKTTIYRTSSCHHMVHLVPIPQERASHLVLVWFGRYMFSGGRNSVTNRSTTALNDVKTTIYRTSSCQHMVYFVPIPQERASHLVLVWFGRYMFSGGRNSVTTGREPLLTSLFHN
jgi:hypothetical protein